jgi:8-oxo-dGTP diphosphatase
MLKRHTRYQAAILEDDRLLLIKVHNRTTDETFWVIPGGGREGNESEEACVRREVQEETHLNVKVERLLLEEPGAQDGIYQRLKTYLCTIQTGQPQPGVEPEVEFAETTTIQAVGWFDLRQPDTWDRLVLNDPFTYPLLHRLRHVMGYASETG